MQSPNYKVGAVKRKIGVSDSWKPGELISEMNKSKIISKKVTDQPSKLSVAIKGLV